MSGDSRSFRGHCASALTHPATIAAVVVLLLNDALFKSLWPDAWVTGKLSDLAWVVFASPLLAFILSLFPIRRPFAERAAIITAYVGLPALYAAFNTFQPVHDWILRGLSLVAGGTAGSPLDPTDSLVIPFGLGIAVWVWRRRPVGPDKLRVRLALLAAGVATFATIATSPEVIEDTGIETVGVASDGSIVATARVNDHSVTYISADGGLTWMSDNSRNNIKRGRDEVETPRGTYRVRGPEISVLTVSGGWKIVFSAAYPQERSSLRVQQPTPTSPVGRRIDRKSNSIVYHARSSNLVVAMGREGVAVGSPDGKWTTVAVGEYVPTDFLSLKQSREFHSTMSLLAIAIALSASMAAFSLTLSQFRIENPLSGFAVVLVAFAFLIGLPELSETLELSSELVVSLLVLLFAAAIATAMYLADARDTSATRMNGFALATCCMIMTGALLRSFGGTVESPDGIVNLAIAAFIVLLAVAAMRIPWQLLKHRVAVVATFAGMNGLVILVFVLQEQMGFGMNFARISAVTLVALAALALITQLKRQRMTTRD